LEEQVINVVVQFGTEAEYRVITLITCDLVLVNNSFKSCNSAKHNKWNCNV